MRVEEALEFFENIPRVKNKLQILMDVGLSYIKLGQSAPTLSGGLLLGVLPIGFCEISTTLSIFSIPSALL